MIVIEITNGGNYFGEMVIGSIKKQLRKEIYMRNYRYLVSWYDYEGIKHEKRYVTVDSAMRKLFAVCGWFKNGIGINIATGKSILQVF